MSQQNQRAASGDCTTSERPSVFASAAEQKILGILKHGPAIVALRRTPSDGVIVEILAQCRCELAPNKHEGAEHRSDCAFMKLLTQLDTLPPAIAPQKSQPVCDEVPKASPGLPLESDKITTSCGATSSKCPRFDLIPIEGLIGLANRFEEGLLKHGKDNWRKGIGNREYVIERLNHAIYHAKKLIEKLDDRRPWDGDDDASAIAWAGVTAKTMLQGKR